MIMEVPYGIQKTVSVSERNGECPVTNMGRFRIKLCPILFNNIIELYDVVIRSERVMWLVFINN